MMEVLSAPKASLMRLMKRRVKICVQEASKELNLAPSTIRQHLASLEDHGLVDSCSERKGVGRPRKLYFLTDNADQFFPSRNEALLSQLVRFLQSQGAEGELAAFFENKSAELQACWKRNNPQLTRQERLEQLQWLMEQRGYMPQVDFLEENRICVEMCHCPYAAITDHLDAPCRLERQVLATILGGSVKQVNHRSDDGSPCRFIVKLPPRPKSIDEG